MNLLQLKFLNIFISFKQRYNICEYIHHTYIKKVAQIEGNDAKTGGLARLQDTNFSWWCATTIIGRPMPFACQSANRMRPVNTVMRRHHEKIVACVYSE